jgi:hypothetical protein
MKSRIRSVLARQKLEQMLKGGAGKFAAEVRRDVLSTNSEMDIITCLSRYNHENGSV